MLTPSVSIIGSAIGIYMKSRQQSLSWWIVFSLAGGLVFCAFLSSYYTHIKPLRDPAANGRLLLDSIGGRIIKYGTVKGVPLRLNMLLVYRPARFLFVKRYFRVRWGSSEMKFAPDGAVQFHISKGVAGEAYATGKSKLVNMEIPENKGNWGFTAKELKRFPDHTMIWSYPIYELDKNGDPTGTILGAINLDSMMPGAVDVVLKDHEFAKFMEELRDIASRVTSC